MHITVKKREGKYLVDATLNTHSRLENKMYQLFSCLERVLRVAINISLFFYSTSEENRDIDGVSVTSGIPHYFLLDLRLKLQRPGIMNSKSTGIAVRFYINYAPLIIVIEEI